MQLFCLIYSITKMDVFHVFMQEQSKKTIFIHPTLTNMAIPRSDISSHHFSLALRLCILCPLNSFRVVLIECSINALSFHMTSISQTHLEYNIDNHFVLLQKSIYHFRCRLLVSNTLLVQAIVKSNFVYRN